MASGLGAASCSQHENSPRTPNFVMQKTGLVKRERNDYTMTADQVSSQRHLDTSKTGNFSQSFRLRVPDEVKDGSPFHQQPAIIGSTSRQNSARALSGMYQASETTINYKGEDTKVTAKMTNVNVAQPFQRSSSQNSLFFCKFNNQIVKQDSFNLSQGNSNEAGQHKANKLASSKYQKLPPRKGKYNEPYHDGLYRFQDQQLVIPKGSRGSDNKNRKKSPTLAEDDKVPKIQFN